MKIKFIGKEPKQDGKTGKWYLPNEVYEVDDKKRAKELLDTKLFEEMKENKQVKEETN